MIFEKREKGEKRNVECLNEMFAKNRNAFNCWFWWNKYMKFQLTNCKWPALSFVEMISRKPLKNYSL